MSKPVVFLYPGIGDHAGLLGTSLLNLPLYKAVIVDGFEYLKAQHEIDMFWTLSYSNQNTNNKINSFSARLRHARSGRVEANRKSTDKDKIQRTVYAHPFLFLHQLALSKYLEENQIIADYCIGYSLGEYSAAAHCGAMGFYDALDLIATRAKLVEQQPQSKMLAVAAGIQDIAELILPEVSIVSINSPLQTIIAGPNAVINAQKLVLDEAQMVYQQVRADHGFHTPLLNPIKSALADWIENNLPRTTREPLIKSWCSSINLTFVDKGCHFDHAYWLTQLVSPVQFSSIAGRLKRVHGDLIEVGPGRSLSSLLKQNPLFPQDQWPNLFSLLPSLNETNDQHSYLEQQLQGIKNSVVENKLDCGVT